ncbi:hypothetical protein GGF38_002428 [Coemansia sp. RSA 25]|nr:hypothetical protein GGF38_002428 [Coemansia sp. RSA 25]
MPTSSSSTNSQMPLGQQAPRNAEIAPAGPGPLATTAALLRGRKRTAKTPAAAVPAKPKRSKRSTANSVTVAPPAGEPDAAPVAPPADDAATTADPPSAKEVKKRQYNEYPGMQQPPDEGGVTWKSGDEKVIVMSLRDLVKDPVLLEYIYRCVRSMTILRFKTSRLLLLHLQRLCDKKQADPTMVFPAVNVTMFCHLFYMLQDNFIQKLDAVVEKYTAEERESYAM